MKNVLRTLIVAALVVVCPNLLSAQSDPRFEVGAQAASVRAGEFEGTDVGVGGRLSWNPIALLGLEGEVTFYPDDYPDPLAFSAGRTEYFFGVTVGPRLGPIRPFVRARAGGLDVQAAPKPIICLAIFPPQLSCTLAQGENLAAFDIGGGFEFFGSPRTFFRVDVGDRMLKYPGQVLRPNGTAETDGFYGNEFRIAVGGGFRF